MTTLVASQAGEPLRAERGRGAAFVPHFWPEQGLSRYSLGSIISTSEGSVVRFGVVAGAAQFARLLAIKQLNPVVSRQPFRVARFMEEIRIHARVRHPNVVGLLDVVESGAESWLVMEHVSGATLSTIFQHRRASGRPLEVELAAGIVAPLLRGLHAVHETKDDAGLPLCIVHGAVSPRHVMVDHDGQVKLIDFGMARAVGEASSLGLRRAPGRFGHLSPELVLGERVDRRSDVFAAGIVLWEAVAGRALFEESGVSDADGLRRVLRAPIPELRSVRGDVSKALSAVVHKALQRDRAQRFATAAEFASALEEAVTPASPPRLSALVTSLGAKHFEPTRQALAAICRSLPPPLARPRFNQGAEGADVEEDTVLALTGRFIHGDTLSPTNSAVAPAAAPLYSTRSPSWHPVMVALVAAALAVSLVFAFRKHAPRAAAPLPADTFVVAATTAAPAPELPVMPVPSLEPDVHLAEPIPIEALPLISSSEDAEPLRRTRRRGGHAGIGHQSRARFTVGASSRAAGCSPPTYLGDDGIRHFKDHCL